jgi:hypothetical protein
MSDIAINPVTRRVQFTGNTGLGPFAFTFNILVDGDIAVFKNDTLLVLSTDYTISTNADGTGSVTLTGSGNGTALVSADFLTIVGGRQLARTTDFVTAGDLLASSLNEQLDSNVIMVQQLDEKFARALRIDQFDETADMTLPAKADRAGRFLAFDTNGNPTATTNVGDFKGDWAASTIYRIGDLVKDTTDDSIYRVNADHTSSGALPLTTNTNAAFYDLFVDLSDINASEAAAAASASAAASSASAASTSETNAAASASTASTQATNSANSATSSANSATAAQTAQAAAEAALDTFDDRFLGAKASDPTLDNDGNALLDGAIYFNTTDDIMKVYDLTNTVWRDLALTGSDQTNVNLVAGQISPTNNIATVAGVASDIPTVAGINTTHLSNVSGVATEIGRLGTADAVADMNTLGTAAIVTDMDTLADRATDIGLLADIEDGTTATNAIQTVAANLSGVNSFAERYRVGASDPTTSLDEGDLFFNTTSNSYKFYDGSAWNTVNVSGIGSVADDASPQLGGNLSSNGNDVNFGDNDKATFGAGSDLQIYHDGSGSIVYDNGTGPLNLQTNNSNINIKGGGSASHTMAIFKSTEGVELYYNNVKKFETTSTGVDVTGVITTDGMTTSADINFGDNDKAIFGAGSDLQIYHDGSDSYITDSGTGNLRIQAQELLIEDPSGNDYFFGISGAQTAMCYAGTAKLATTSTGVDVTGVITTDGMTTSADINFGDSDKAVFGAGNDLQIYHDGSNSYIYENGTGDLKIATNGGNIRLQKTLTEIMGDFKIDGSVDLYHNNVKKFETTSSGVSVTGTVAATAVTGDGSGLTNLPTSGYNAPWVNFNGTGTVAIRDSLLTSSISDLGTGDYRHNFSSSCANSSYAVANGGSRDDPENSRTFMIHIDNLATGSYDISCHNDGSTSVDFTNLFSITQGDF